MSVAGEHARTLLQTSDGPPFAIVNPDGANPIILVCEHASNRVPERLGTLGLTPRQLESHVAWDPGALDLAERLSAALDARLIAARFSRLVYDCNRPPDAASAMPEETEVCPIPGNMSLTRAARRTRAAEIHAPFHAALADLIASRRAAGVTPIVVTVHSFTPVFNGTHRDVEIGLLHAGDDRLAEAMRGFCAGNSSHDVRINAPYGPADGVLHTIEKQLGAGPFPYVMIEVKNDLLASWRGRAGIAALLGAALAETASHPDFNATTRPDA